MKNHENENLAFLLVP